MVEGVDATRTGLEFRTFFPSDIPKKTRVALDYGAESISAGGHEKRSPSTSVTATVKPPLDTYPVEFVILRNSILKEIDEYQEAMESQYYSVEEGSPEFLKWADPIVPVKRWISDDVINYENTTFWVSYSTMFLF